MNSIEYEFIRGILFFRFKNFNEEGNRLVSNMIKDNQIKNIVFNLRDINYIDNKGINFLNYNYNLCKNNKSKIIFCDINDSIKDKLLYLPITSNELTALKTFNI